MKNVGLKLCVRVKNLFSGDLPRLRRALLGAPPRLRSALLGAPPRLKNALLGPSQVKECFIGYIFHLLAFRFFKNLVQIIGQEKM